MRNWQCFVNIIFDFPRPNQTVYNWLWEISLSWIFPTNKCCILLNAINNALYVRVSQCSVWDLTGSFSNQMLWLGKYLSVFHQLHNLEILSFSMVLQVLKKSSNLKNNDRFVSLDRNALQKQLAGYYTEYVIYVGHLKGSTFCIFR